jgi:hypothetical protein
MKTTTYTVTGTSGANLRLLPSTASDILETVPPGTEVDVVDKITASNTNGTQTVYLLVNRSGRYGWAAGANLTKKQIDYQKRVKNAAFAIYPLCIGKKHGKGVQNRVKTLEHFKAQKELNCHLMVSLCLQKAGLLPVGKVITHTPKSGGKTYIQDAVKGLENLKHCRYFWVNKPYDQLPDRWKEAGIVYIQNSNACISMWKGHIFSCNKQVGYRYQSKHDYDRTTGYPHTSNILVVIVPNK